MDDEQLPDRLRAVLDPGERVRWHAAPTWSRQYIALAALCGVVTSFSGAISAVFLLASVGKALGLRLIGVGTALILGGGFVGGGVLGWWLVARYRRNLHYAATDRRIIHCRGLVRPSCRSVPWTDVSRVEHRSRPGRGGDVTFPDVPQATRWLQSEGLSFRGLADARRATRRLRAIRETAVDEPDHEVSLPAAARSSLPETIRGQLREAETLVYTTEPDARYETMTGTPLVVATVSLSGLVMVGSAVASAFLWGVVPVLWVGAVGVVVGVATWYLLGTYERRYHEEGMVVVTDRQVIRYDGTSEELETLPWDEAEGVITDGGHPKVLERETPVQGRYAHHYVGLTVPATDRQEPVYRRLRQLYERRG